MGRILSVTQCGVCSPLGMCPRAFLLNNGSCWAGTLNAAFAGRGLCPVSLPCVSLRRYFSTRSNDKTTTIITSSCSTWWIFLSIIWRSTSSVFVKAFTFTGWCVNISQPRTVSYIVPPASTTGTKVRSWAFSTCSILYSVSWVRTVVGCLFVNDELVSSVIASPLLRY